MNKKLIAIVLTSIMLIPTAAYAEGKKETVRGKSETHTELKNSPSKTEAENQVVTSKENKNKVQENKAAIQDFKAQIKAKHEIMKSNTRKFNELKKQISTKKIQISSILKDIKLGTKTLSADQLSELTTKAAALKETVTELKKSPELKSDVDNTQQAINSNKFEAALASLDKVITKQESRYARLVELNTKVDELLAIAVQAQPVNTVPSTSSDSKATTEVGTTDSTETSTLTPVTAH